ncbi:hypothetical protein K3X48_05885 [Aliiroseovarius crassostreae]|uniref:Uncharacterized protein n=1 Tax=Aliiroseovarius crassostreae TaxID=154981 RepID=A0A9Q9HAE7_9RHOB|nr:hypothetical protein [Aliiroseovarius crassostreae]UWP96504.1 hypothetical protein K3X48_05885 [Aliiroseovarius crassostreae]
MSEDQLPPKMQRFLKDIDTGRAYSAPALQKKRANVSSALRCLAETAQMKRLPVALCAETADAVIERLQTANWSPSAVASFKTMLRHYAYETDEGVDWALSSGATDRRPVELVLRAPHWAPYRAILPMVIESGISAREIRLADRWLRHCNQVTHLSVDHAMTFRADPGHFRGLAQFMTSIDPGNPDTRILQAAQRKRRSTAKGVTKKPAYGELPEPFLSQMKMISRKPKELGGYSTARIKSMGCAIRRLIRSAKQRGLKPELTMETATTFAEDLLSGGLKTISAAGYCEFLGYFAKRAGYPAEIGEELLETHWSLKAEARTDLKRKEIKLANVPIDLVDLAKTASEILEQAPLQEDIRNRRRDYTLAGAIALLCKLQIRAKDLREGKIGKEFSRDSESWSVDLKTSKTGTYITGRLADCLTPFLDAVLLMDTDPAYLWKIYDQRVGTALFANPARDWKCYEREWLRRNMTERTGHSAHIVRTLIYDYVTLDAELDAKVAQALVGHAHATSKLFYEANADRYRRMEALKGLATIEKSLPG